MTKLRRFLIEFKTHPIGTLALIAWIVALNWTISANNVVSWIVISLPVLYWLFIFYEFWRSQRDEKSK
ncbi:hypothetical protein KTE19_02230 [Lentilactobacillus sp. IMAU92037]|uniref:hypothetical protein n=1 Tax=Lentilactobacillus TaxID=2767893 RepID=UPI001C254980|nr:MULTISPECIES: hypothetical protein [Lentilactobacillus]MBU9788171.1 hypothetical protein [Lentilactobacillus dabitei]MBV0929543.1 hypothetical protein [Lentilactobacillus dabitei]MDM7515121.1 hypothetical protein [Lentilactobacillus sp. TOM.63]